MKRREVNSEKFKALDKSNSKSGSWVEQHLNQELPFAFLGNEIVTSIILVVINISMVVVAVLL